MADMRFADYQILGDGPIVLGAGQEKEYKFTLPTSTIRTGNQRPIISFKVRPEGVWVGDMEFSVDLNDVPEINDEKMNGSDRRVFWEVVDPNRANAGVENTVQFRVTNGVGKLRFSDVVFIYQRT